MVISTLPQVHASLLGLAAFGAVACAGVVLASNPGSKAARLHYMYALCLGWWFVCQAMIATSQDEASIERWARLAHLALGMLPAVVFHLNVSLTGLTRRYATRVRVHWTLAVALTALLLSWPSLFGPPSTYAWGSYMRYTGWGLLAAVPLVVAVVEMLAAYVVALPAMDPRSAQYHKARVFLRGNVFAALALVDFLPAFGVGVYPFGFAVISVMHVITLYGSVRYRLIQMTPEYASEHVLGKMPDGVLLIDAHGRVQVANRPAAAALGCEVEELLDRPLGAAGNTDVVEHLLIPHRSEAPLEFSYVDHLGAKRHLRVSASTISDQLGIPVAELWTLHDVTAEWVAREEKELLEAGIRSAQKLESLGVMARGIAHDFNNLLLGISGNAELARQRAGGDADLREHLTKIETTVQRASDLTGQMLTYTGDAPMNRGPISLNHVVADVTGLMGAAISKKASLSLELHPALPDVIADSSQLGQVILNLIVNASESIQDDVGSIILRTGLTRPDASFHRWRDETPQPVRDDYVFLEVCDTGAGMDEETLGRIFDPFFTTKFAGRGLGLAAVIGIVRAHGGLTRVTSHPERGTTFTVAFPLAPRTHGEVRSLAKGASWRGRGVALLADDEPEVRSVTRAMLAGAGFSVIEAADGAEAVSEFRARADDIVLVVLDRTMPVLDGREAFAKIRAISSEVPVLFISGYTDAHLEALDSRTAFLHKPFKTSALSAKIQEAMNV